MILSKNRLMRKVVVALSAVALAAAATAAQARTLSFALPSPPTETGMNKALQWWADEIKNRTEGSLDIKFYYMQSLVKFQDAGDAVSAGVADIAYISPLHSQTKMPLWYLGNTRVGSGDQYVVAEALRRVRDRFPPMHEEEKKNNMKYIVHVSNGPQVLLSKSRPYLTPADFKGDKVRMPGSLAHVARQVKWDVGPVSLPFPDIYSAMERGTVDGAMTYVPLIRPYSHNEVAKHVVEPRLGQNSNVIMMNLNTWNSLGEEEQKVIDDLQHELMLRLAKGNMDDEKRERELLQSDDKNPLVFHQLTAEQRQLWAQDLEHGAVEMVERMAKRNPKAREFHEAYMREIEKVEQEVAEKGYPWDPK